MAAISADKSAKVSTEGWFENTRFLLPWCCNITINTYISSVAASNFVETYYSALNRSRETIASFYMQATTMADGKSLPVILFNGNVIESPDAMQTMFKNKIPESHYEVQDYDCHVLNPHYIPENATHVDTETGKNMVILVNVNGQVRYGEDKSALNPLKGFSETVVLVPNPLAARKERGRALKEWLIQSQNFRLVV